MSDGFTREPTLRPFVEGDLLTDEKVQEILDTLDPPLRELLTRHIMACERKLISDYKQKLLQKGGP